MDNVPELHFHDDTTSDDEVGRGDVKAVGWSALDVSIKPNVIEHLPAACTCTCGEGKGLRGLGIEARAGHGGRPMLVGGWGEVACCHE